MAFKVLAIGRGRDGITHSIGDIGILQCFDSAYENNTPPQFRDLVDYNYVIQHLGPDNPECLAAIAHWKAKGWGDKIFGVTGSPSIPVDYSSADIPTFVSSSGYNALLKLRWDIIPKHKLENVSTKADDIYDLLTVTSDFLLAFIILCQGYLVFMTCKDNKLVENESVQKALLSIGWFNFASVTGDPLHPTASYLPYTHINFVDNRLWWSPVSHCLREVISVELNKYNIVLDERSEISDLVNAISTQITSTDKTLELDVVAKGYLDIIRVFNER